MRAWWWLAGIACALVLAAGLTSCAYQEEADMLPALKDRGSQFPGLLPASSTLPMGFTARTAFAWGFYQG